MHLAYSCTGRELSDRLEGWMWSAEMTGCWSQGCRDVNWGC